MNPSRAYLNASRAALSPRETEASLLEGLARSLEGASDDATRDLALERARRLWATLAAAAVRPENPLPNAAKAAFAALAVGVLRASFTRSPKTIAFIAEASREVAAGLREKPTDAAAG